MQLKIGCKSKIVLQVVTFVIHTRATETLIKIPW